MTYKNTTQVPNFIFDLSLSLLTESELKVLLVVIRQTHGWIDVRTGMRKERDRISGSQFQAKTGLSKRIITLAIQKLVDKGMLEVSAYKGNILRFARDRKGQAYLFYRVLIPEHFKAHSKAQLLSSAAHNCYHNKTKGSKITGQKETRHFSGHIGELIVKKKLFTPIPQEYC